jgi:hypothetical protein
MAANASATLMMAKPPMPGHADRGGAGRLVMVAAAISATPATSARSAANHNPGASARP